MSEPTFIALHRRPRRGGQVDPDLLIRVDAIESVIQTSLGSVVWTPTGRYEVEESPAAVQGMIRAVIA